MRLLLACTLFVTGTTAFADAPSAPFAVPSAPIVDLGYAKYQGTLNSETGNIDFLGIRYAAAPTGSRRWREPQPPENTPGVQPADKLPNRCMQNTEQTLGLNTVSPFLPTINSLTRRDTSEPPPRSEDCLFLNIATPANGTGNLPVVVWIHGGGYVFGGTWQYNPDDLVRASGGNAVVVLIQWRLGAFGFLSGQKVRDDGVLNAGLLDQQFALQWVQGHISKFGGDPSKVTIWGESCGAGSVMQHLIANNGNTRPKLFRGGITSSTFIPPQYAYNHRIPETVFGWVVEQTGCSSASDQLDCLRKVDVDVLNQANVNITTIGFFGLLTFTPVVDGTFITDRPTALLRRGQLNADSLLAVVNRNESGRPNLVDPNIADTVKVPEFILNLWPTMPQRYVDQAVDLYKDLGRPIDQAIAINSDSIFICPTYLIPRAMNGKAFMGLFDIPPAWHLDDFAYYFPTSLISVNASKPFDNTEFKNNFAQSFLNFAISQDPNIKWDPNNTLPQWPRFTEGARLEMLFNRTEDYQPVFEVMRAEEDLLRRCDFWESVSQYIWQ